MTSNSAPTPKKNFVKNINLLLFTTLITIFVIVSLLVLHIYNLKSTTDDLFKLSVAPIIELENIKDIYDSNLNTALEILKDDPSQENLQTVEVMMDDISDHWQNYTELSTTDMTQQRLLKIINRIFLVDTVVLPYNYYKFELEKRITNKINYLKKIRENPLNKQNINTIKENLISLNSDTYALIVHYLKEMNNHKIRIDYTYNKSIETLILFLVFAFVLSFLIIFLLTKHSKRINLNLEDTVWQKTKELQLLNESLETRLKDELEISRRKDKTIFEQSRAAEIGEMMQNVSHQWRQPLGAITMIIQSFETKLEKNKLTPEFIRTQVNEALILANNMSTTLEDFRNFHSPQKVKCDFMLNELIKETLRFAKFLVEQEKILIKVNLDKDVKIHSYKNELMHVLINIIYNAKDAMEKNSGEKIIDIYTKVLEKSAKIVIIDNGGGVKEEVIDKIFDPYFTTKHQSLGTGIGLYMSKQIVEKHMQGKIKVKNVILSYEDVSYKCAEFNITIPLILEKR